jgi:hypothetical protein
MSFWRFDSNGFYYKEPLPKKKTITIDNLAKVRLRLGQICFYVLKKFKKILKKLLFFCFKLIFYIYFQIILM